MEFTSSLFFIFLFLVLLGVQIVPAGKPRVMFYVAMSYIFYANAYLPHIFLLIFITIINYGIARSLGTGKSQHAKRRTFLIAAIIINLSILSVFKYADFIIENINTLFALLHIELLLPLPHITFALGLSFYTFIVIGYLIDIYYNRSDPPKSIIDFSLLIAFFPFILAGPIVRAAEFLPQLYTAKPLERTLTLKGIELLIVGYFKKCVVADNCALLVNSVYANPAACGGLSIWLATFFFTIQIYCDFSGYTDIARGVAKILGFHLPINFRWPYFSHSIREFWRRWHITLSFWIRDYVYFPLGGSKGGTPRYLFNMLVTWFLCGLWHGADYKFIMWGLYNGFFIVIGRFFKQIKRPSDPWKGFRFIMIFTTFIITLIGWMLFRCNHITDAVVMIQKMVNPFDNIMQGMHFFKGVPIIAVFILPVIHFTTYKFHYDVDNVSVLDRVPYIFRVLLITLSILIIILFAGESIQFIYFMF